MDDTLVIGVDYSGSSRDVELGHETTPWGDTSIGACGNGDRELGVDEGFASGRNQLRFGTIEVISSRSRGSSSRDTCGVRVPLDLERVRVTGRGHG